MFLMNSQTASSNTPSQTLMHIQGKTLNYLLTAIVSVPMKFGQALEQLMINISNLFLANLMTGN